MNLPAGKIVRSLEKGKDNFVAGIAELVKTGFTGYFILTIEGYSGIEEGVLFIREGQVIGASFEYPKYGVSVFGDSAAKQFFNALAAKHGVADVCELSKQQLELITTFNEKTILEKQITEKDLERITPKSYTSGFAKQTLGKVIEEQESVHNVFKRAGLEAVDKSY